MLCHLLTSTLEQWEFVPSEDGHAIRSCLKGKDDENLFLTVEGPAKKGARAVGSPYPVTWHIRLAYPPTTEIAFRYPIKYEFYEFITDFRSLKFSIESCGLRALSCSLSAMTGAVRMKHR